MGDRSLLVAEEVPVVVGLCSVSQARSGRRRRAYRVEGLDVRVPDVVGQLGEAREDAGKARPPRRGALGQWHGGRWSVQSVEARGGMFFAER